MKRTEFKKMRVQRIGYAIRYEDGEFRVGASPDALADAIVVYRRKKYAEDARVFRAPNAKIVRLAIVD